MKLSEIVKILDAEVMCCEENLSTEVYEACASDMMSDVLAYVKNQSLLISGLCNPQVARTAAMMDMKCVILARGKRPDEVMLSLAKERGIVIMCTEHKMFETCGMLYEAGIMRNK